LINFFRANINHLKFTNKKTIKYKMDMEKVMLILITQSNNLLPNWVTIANTQKVKKVKNKPRTNTKMWCWSLYRENQFNYRLNIQDKTAMNATNQYFRPSFSFSRSIFAAKSAWKSTYRNWEYFNLNLENMSILWRKLYQNPRLQIRRSLVLFFRMLPESLRDWRSLFLVAQATTMKFHTLIRGMISKSKF